MRYCLLFLFLLQACTYSSLNTGAIADQNKYSFSQIEVGMNREEVFQIMGSPEMIENIALEDKEYEVWYYITQKFAFGQTQVLSRNLTPLVFQDDTLQGWGRPFYRKLLQKDQEDQERKEYYERKRYTDDEEEWPKDEHGYVPSPSEQKD